MIELTKVCTKCGTEKPLSEFHKNSTGKLGVRNICKACRNTNKPKGRPKGTRLSKETRDKIASSRIGSRHNEETKQKISDKVRRIGEPSISIERILATDLKTANKIKVGNYISIYVPNLDNKGEGNYIREHVAIMEQHIGRKLLPGEEIHHWGSKLDNRIEMITLCKDRHHHNKLNKIKDKLKKRFN